MKKLFKSITMVLALVLVLSAVPTVNVDAASKVKLNKTTVSLKEGKTTTLKVKGTKKKVKWSSSNKKVATVNQKGKVTAKKKGKATITAKVAGKKYKCIVTVKAKKSELPTFSSFAEMRAYVISLGYPLGTAVDNGDGTATAYFFDFDGETSFADTWPNQSHDVSNARNQARIILVNDGFHYMGRSQASKVAVAKDPAGFTYYVYGEKNWHKPTNCDGTSCY